MLTACAEEIKPPEISVGSSQPSFSQQSASHNDNAPETVEFSRESLEQLTPEQFKNWHKQFSKYLARDKKLNSDVTAWISIAPFNVSYPVVKPLDNEQYVRRDIYDMYNPAGTLFFDQEMKSMDDKNVIVYGHNMKDGSMFACLNELTSEEDFSQCVVAITTEDETRLYLPQAVYVTEKLNEYIENNPAEIEDVFVEESEAEPAVYLNKNDGVLTLTTCNGDESDLNRRVVQFVRYNPF